MMVSATKKSAGSAGKPRSAAPGGEGRGKPAGAHAERAAEQGARGAWVTKRTRVWGASDSTNHPERNSAGSALNGPSMSAKVMKSKIELIGPKTSMKCRMKRRSQGGGRAGISASTVSVGIAIWLVS